MEFDVGYNATQVADDQVTNSCQLSRCGTPMTMETLILEWSTLVYPLVNIPKTMENGGLLVVSWDLIGV